MTKPIDRDALQTRLEELIALHHIPGASLAVLHGDEVIEAAAGVVNKNTGVETTTDTLFQIGSITKSWTATLVMMAVEEGLLDLDAPVVTYLPELKFADPDVTKRVRLRHFLSHSSGVGGDHILDTGRGDDNLENYLLTCADIGQEHELGATMSYCNTGYSLMGLMLQRVMGKGWDQLMRERIFEPLGLAHTNTLPEEALLFHTAVGHVKRPGEDDYTVARKWVLPRSAGPAGLINSTAADTLAFARFHLDEGRAADGTQLLSPGLVKQMQQPEIDVPDRYTLGDSWGLGWILFNWDGSRLFGHDGATMGQYAKMRILAEPRVAIVLLTNGGEAAPAFRTLCTEILRDTADVAVPRLPAMPDAPTALDLAPYEGTFGRLNITTVLECNEEGGLTGTTTTSGPLAERLEQEERVRKVRLTPVDRELFLVRSETDPTAAPTPLVFFDFDGDAPRRYHSGARAMRRL